LQTDECSAPCKHLLPSWIQTEELHLNSAGKFVKNSAKQIQKWNLAYSLAQFLKSLGKVTYKQMFSLFIFKAK
jgi:hypothetical protein